MLIYTLETDKLTENALVLAVDASSRESLTPANRPPLHRLHSHPTSLIAPFMLPACNRLISIDRGDAKGIIYDADNI